MIANKPRFCVFATCDIYLPFLGEEVTGKTIAVIGTGRIGQAFIKKAVGFDVDFLCHDGGIEDLEFAPKIQEAMDVRFKNGFTAEPHIIRYVGFEAVVRGADLVSVHVPLVREGEGKTPPIICSTRRHFGG